MATATEAVLLVVAFAAPYWVLSWLVWHFRRQLEDYFRRVREPYEDWAAGTLPRRLYHRPKDWAYAILPAVALAVMGALALVGALAVTLARAPG